jgi:hypothetical protein
MKNNKSLRNLNIVSNVTKYKNIIILTLYFNHLCGDEGIGTFFMIKTLLLYFSFMMTISILLNIFSRETRKFHVNFLKTQTTIDVIFWFLIRFDTLKLLI